MKNLITALFVLSHWYAYAQPSDYLTEIDGNMDITDTATIANENVMILNRYLDFSNEFSSAGGINLYEKVGQLFALNQNKRVGIYAHGNSWLYPSMHLYSSDQKSMWTAKANDTYGGHLDLANENGQTQLSLRGMESSGDGGQILLRNADQEETIEIDGDSNDDGGIIKIMDKNGDNRVTIYAAETSDDNPGAAMCLYNSDGERTIEIDADIDGMGRLISNEFQLNGGSDLAEKFDVSAIEVNSIQPGMLVSIDPNGAGKLVVTQEKRDKKIAGVISGANGIRPGIWLSQTETIADGQYPVAIAGRVYVKATDENGIIEPGDFLTSSSQSGYAMKADISDQGAIVGKALTSLSEGYVLILVNVQ